MLNVILCLKFKYIFKVNMGNLKEAMEKLDKLWHMQMSLTTFIVAFFLNKAHTVWGDQLSNGRR